MAQAPSSFDYNGHRVSLASLAQVGFVVAAVIGSMSLLQSSVWLFWEGLAAAELWYYHS